mmetsp:Transcript_22924/g.52416  ORF Transcript_22924/g.52416 Transcript_22924/m.52416 type:complete len:262 (+) Transcript_22924:1071-1856(+)
MWAPITPLVRSPAGVPRRRARECMPRSPPARVVRREGKVDAGGGREGSGVEAAELVRGDAERGGRLGRALLFEHELATALGDVHEVLELPGRLELKFELLAHSAQALGEEVDEVLGSVQRRRRVGQVGLDVHEVRKGALAVLSRRAAVGEGLGPLQALRGAVVLLVLLSALLPREAVDGHAPRARPVEVPISHPSQREVAHVEELATEEGRRPGGALLEGGVDRRPRRHGEVVSPSRVLAVLGLNADAGFYAALEVAVVRR